MYPMHSIIPIPDIFDDLHRVVLPYKRQTITDEFNFQSYFRWDMCRIVNDFRIPLRRIR